MSRPAAVTVSAVVALIGSVLALVLALILLFTAGTATPELEQLRVFFTWIALAVAALAVLGVWTAIDILRLKRWARTSLLVFSGVAAAVCALGIGIVLLIPVTRTNVPANVQRNAELVAIMVYAVPLVICAWWLWLFNTAPVKAAFASEGPIGTPRRPLSVSIIGWWYLLGGILTLVPALMGMPAFLAGFILEGLPARVAYLVFAVLSAMIGWDLLQLRERGRRLAIGLLLLGAAHGVVTTFVPSVRQRMLEFGRRTPSDAAPGAPSLEGLMTALMVVTLALIAVAIWLLVRNKAAFETREEGGG